MVPILSLLLMTCAALGGGALILKATGTFDRMGYLERLTISFSLGIGVMGWSIFFLALGGQIHFYALIALLIALASGLFYLKAPAKMSKVKVKPDPWRLSLLIVMALLLFYDVLEGVVPPADADSLAYHFSLPKAFLNAGGLFPVYQAIEGTIPLLQQMTYMSALGVGGEQAMTLWTMASGWAATALVFVIAKRFVSTNWALAISLVLLSTPAVLYGAGSGQIEVRNASFVLVAALAISEARRTDLLRFAALAGIAAGFFVASKYTGLIFGFSAGLFLLFQKRWFAHGLVFSGALLLAGGQWYGWNFWITGDPIFPLLYGKIDYLANVPWNDNIHEAYKGAITGKPLAANFFWYIFYPVKATLFAEPGFESLRVGFGPLILLLLPFTLLVVWRYRNQFQNHPLTVYGGICLIAYTIWFFIGPSQRVRHLLPLYPLLLLCVSVTAVQFTHLQPNGRGAVSLAFILTTLLHMMGATVYAANHIRFAISNESRDSFLKRTVSQYGAAAAANKFLSAEDNVLVSTRQIVFHINSPVFYANSNQQAVVEIHGKTSDPKILWNQLQQRKITHILLPFKLQTQGPHSGYPAMAHDLKRNKCLYVLDQFEALSITSRTLPTLGSSKSQFSLVELTPSSCRYGPD